MLVGLLGCGSGGHTETTGRSITSTLSRQPATAGAAKGTKVALNYNCAAPAALIPRARATHSAWIRIPIYWAELEPAEGAYSQSYLKEITNCLDFAHRDGLHVLAVFLSTPGWANNRAGIHAPPTDDSTYAAAIGYLARAYPASGTSGIDAFEIWNEANSTWFWTGTISQYERLLAAASDAVRTHSTAEVVLAGTAHIDESWDRTILADGYGRYFDVLGVHPYPNQPANTNVPAVFNGSANAPNTLDQLRTDLNRYGYPDKPIWLTEIGWSTHYVAASVQAAALTRMYDYIRNSGCYACSRIKLAFWYTLLDPNGGFDGGASLLNQNLASKPAYAAMVGLRR